ncbi:hypothetical protein SERLADRAFT_435695 [Serpula lacrymans var. lacrymans S7.9]|uniref:Uncharacterized protein n=1 Tax=Serpula lacrymans var. lacrymans (strain S7.9) TaxID=578457 RepID=F8NMU5_SERL9|nr:uncharacterized protein SERLADRAFT_435695 [Serpula lacrymans var. lacrymans S7.9]EGO27921.1 hypothetical protein SERLADRAFT_435695 [Serpula lacrymans var. lacrymans S7.9]
MPKVPNGKAKHSEEWVSEADRRHQRDFLAALNKPLPVLPVPTEARIPDTEETVEQITELYQNFSALSSLIDPIEEIILDIHNALALTQSIFYHSAISRFDQLIATAQRKICDGEDYTAEIDNIQYVSEYVEKYYWILEILTPFVVNQQSDYPEHFIVTVI